MKIQITKTDIKRGRKYDANGCPIARAVKREMRKQGKNPKNYMIDVTSVLQVHKIVRDGARIVGLEPEISKSLPENGRKFVEAFDQYGEVKPFTLELVGVEL